MPLLQFLHPSRLFFSFHLTPLISTVKSGATCISQFDVRFLVTLLISSFQKSFQAFVTESLPPPHD